MKLNLENGKHLILETKGRDTDKDQTKRRFLDEWMQVQQTSVNSYLLSGNAVFDLTSPYLVTNNR